MNYIPPFAHTEKEALSPEKRKEVEAERMYKEYKEQCKWGRKPKTLGEFNLTSLILILLNLFLKMSGKN